MWAGNRTGGKRGRKPKPRNSPLEGGFIEGRTRRPRLASSEGWRRELQFVYRETLEGGIPTAEATRLPYIVNVGAGDREGGCETCTRYGTATR